ncbi:hypothetical protein BsIDN1_32460 [Bacillus safensis]|uniref:Uncharacterized protein n=1 Tax=Bacillus safensis TaxID=561879 RepID=A0A5S9M9S0_BACIA|nr:hypothetical protein BsIDN1_32460 [Bacillus safensis]
MLKPNVVYSTKQGYTYTTDHYGRIVKVEASDLKYGEVKKKPICPIQFREAGSING